MVALHDLHWNFLFSCQMICKQHIILNHMFFQYKSNLEIRTHYIDVTFTLMGDLDLLMTHSHIQRINKLK